MALKILPAKKTKLNGTKRPTLPAGADRFVSESLTIVKPSPSVTPVTVKRRAGFGP